MQNKNKKISHKKKTSFKWKAIILLEIFTIIINGLIAVIIWNTVHSTVRESLRDELIAVASSSAAVIDVEKHEKLQGKQDFEKPEYLDTKKLLQKIKNSNGKVDDIYTMRKTEDENTWQFVVSADVAKDSDENGVIDDLEKVVEIGERYDVSQYPQMKTAFDGSVADEEISCDKWGCWLSGYAPIYDEQGRAVAIVGVDMSAKDVLAFEKKVRNDIIAVVCLLVIVLPLFFYAILSYLSKPMKVIMKGIRDFRSDMNMRLDIRTGDEFEMIAVTFNTMANELQQLYCGLEGKVKEKTLQLEEKVSEIQRRNAKDEALLASIGDGLVATDNSGKIIMMNRSAVEIMGVSDVDSLLNVDYCERAILEDDYGQLIPSRERPVRKALDTGSVISMNCQLLKDDGKRIPLMMTASPIVMKGETIGVIVVFKDITREKEIDRAKSEFVSLASHQLRTPLSSIKWYTEMLITGMAGKTSLKQQKYLKQIYSANQRMVELVNSLLNVSRIEMGTFSIEAGQVDMKDILEETIKETTSAMHEKKVFIEKSVSDDAAYIEADPSLMRIILQNLVSNAVKYTQNGGKVQIDISRDNSESANGSISGDFVISVSDTGMGIPEDQQGRIFGKLFRADNAREQVADGNGLGLYIVKSILDVSGGSISFYSKENIGTTFFVRIPAIGMKKRSGEKRLNFCTAVNSQDLHYKCEVDNDNKK